MKTPYRHDERGIAHLIALLVVLAVVGLIAFIGWKITDGGSSRASIAEQSASKAAEFVCPEEDADLCKFMGNWAANEYYTVKSTDTTDGQVTTATYRAEGDKKMHFTVEGAQGFETIVIGDDNYTKASDGTWWKWKHSEKPTDGTAPKDFEYDFGTSAEPAGKDEEPNESKYRFLAKEACGSLTCFKYQVTDPDAANDKQYIWFDDKDYLLRVVRSERADGGISDQTFSYDKFTIEVPSPVKELGPDQYLMPGSDEPVTMPSASDLRLPGNGGSGTGADAMVE